MEESLTGKILETALLCTSEPMKINALAMLFEEGDRVSNDAIKQQLQNLQRQWQNKGLELVELAGGWCFQSSPAMQMYLERLNPEKPPKYSRAVLETLAIIVWHQPVTRGGIEDIRGVSVSAQIIKTLEDRGWIEVIGHKEGPGRPALFGTTKHFLNDLGLKSLTELPTIDSDPDMLVSSNTELAQLLNKESAQLELPQGAESVDNTSEGVACLVKQEDKELTINHNDITHQVHHTETHHKE